jgi:hypothetical protein
VREFLTQLRPVLEGVPVARHEGAVVSVNVGERSKPVVLHLEEPIRMVEGLREPQERHGPECREAFLSGRVAEACWGQAPDDRPHPVRTRGRQ